MENNNQQPSLHSSVPVQARISPLPQTTATGPQFSYLAAILLNNDRPTVLYSPLSTTKFICMGSLCTVALSSQTLSGPPLHRDRAIPPREPSGRGVWGWSAPTLPFVCQESSNDSHIRAKVRQLIQLTDNSRCKICTWKVEDVFLRTIVVMINSLNLQNELLNERTSINSLRIRICVPRFLFHYQCRLWQYCAEPPWNRYKIN